MKCRGERIAVDDDGAVAVAGGGNGVGGRNADGGEGEHGGQHQPVGRSVRRRLAASDGADEDGGEGGSFDQRVGGG